MRSALQPGDRACKVAPLSGSTHAGGAPWARRESSDSCSRLRYFLRSPARDWFKETTIYVMNRADRALAWLDIALQFPQTGNGRTEPTFIYDVRLGRMPDPDSFDARGNRMPVSFAGLKPLNLQPGGTLAIHLSDFHDQIDTYVKKAMPLAAVNRCNISVAVSEFDNGLRYAGGAYSAPDPQQPGHWKYYPTHQYFPGDAHRYLPNLVTR